MVTVKGKNGDENEHACQFCVSLARCAVGVHGMVSVVVTKSGSSATCTSAEGKDCSFLCM